MEVILMQLFTSQKYKDNYIFSSFKALQDVALLCFVFGW